MKPNHLKVAEVISKRIPSVYIIRPGETHYKVGKKRKQFKAELIKRSWISYGKVMEWVEDLGFSWEVETHTDGFSDARLYTPPDKNDILHEVVRDSTYGEREARLSCVCAAIIVGAVENLSLRI